ncbi:MAG: cation transporter [Verrucomicrobiae bacterium]|nr:cation transporter [Verrucomicrobiae bacterium]
MDASRIVKRIFWVTLALNLAVAAAKFVFAAWTHSLSIFSDGLHSLMDGSSNVIALVALRIAEQPPDEDHPYGHRKFETLGAMGISALLCLAAWEILTGAWQRIVHPVKLPEVNAWVLAGMVGLIGVNIMVALYERHWGRKLQNPLLLADAEHTKSDVLATALALVAMFAAFFEWYWMDTVSAVAIVGLILWAAYGIVRDSAMTLSDARRLDPLPIRHLVEEIEGVRNCHMVRSHGTPTNVHVDLHIVVSPKLSSQRTFEIENAVIARIKQAYPQVAEVTIRHQTRMPACEKPGATAQGASGG